MRVKGQGFPGSNSLMMVFPAPGKDRGGDAGKPWNSWNALSLSVCLPGRGFLLLALLSVVLVPRSSRRLTTSQQGRPAAGEPGRPEAVSSGRNEAVSGLLPRSKEKRKKSR